MNTSDMSKMDKAKGIAIMIVILAILGVGLGITGFGLKSAIAKNGELSSKLEDANARLRGWEQAYNNLKKENLRVNSIVADVSQQRESYRLAASQLRNKLRQEAQSNECAKQVIPDGYIRTLVDGLPSRGGQAPNGGSGSHTPSSPGTSPGS